MALQHSLSSAMTKGSYRLDPFIDRGNLNGCYSTSPNVITTMTSRTDAYKISTSPIPTVMLTSILVISCKIGYFITFNIRVDYYDISYLVKEGGEGGRGGHIHLYSKLSDRIIASNSRN